ncbi:MAG: Rieske (2Fe-2S) protein [Acidobacteriota bacterium]|nr:Rieske (2Fe-2S) protein [Acidobacteriota bacterium]
MGMTSTPPRRRFLAWLTRGFLSLWGLGLAWVLASFFKPPKLGGSVAERVIKVGPDESIRVGQARLVRHGRAPVWVIRNRDGALVALSGICTHLRCVLDWDESRNELDCPCHEGRFDLNGNVLGGPAPRSLAKYRVETRLGQIYLHL